MTASIGYGPPERIDGPPPIPPPLGLLPAAERPAAGVRIVPDADGEGIERFLNGVEVFPYPTHNGATFNACAPASEQANKETGPATPPPSPQFGPFTAYVAVQCTTYRVWDQDEFRARAAAVLAAVESSLVANEFLTGNRSKLNPHLSDGTGTFPNLDTVTGLGYGIALLEGAIATSGRLGIIHMSPQAATMGRERFAIEMRDGMLRTINGTPIIPDYGYSVGATPAGGHPAATGSQEWIYATGPVDIRRGPVFTNPEKVEQAVDRASNTMTFRVERDYLVDWDTVVHAAVLVDRCQTTC